MNKKLVFALMTLLLSVFMGSAYAAGNAKAGKDKAAACGGCHGVDGNSMVSSFPKLSGQYAAYIVRQVVDFQKGARNDATMSGMAMTAGSPQDLEDIAAFYASQKMMKGTPAKTAAAKQGQKLYKQGNVKTGVYACVKCHGKNGKGLAKDNPFFPVIGGQHKDYLKKTLQDFKSKARANDPGGMMADVAKKMSDKEIEAVSEYLAGL